MIDINRNEISPKSSRVHPFRPQKEVRNFWKSWKSNQLTRN